mgnify:CR=1 FL=1
MKRYSWIICLVLTATVSAAQTNSIDCLASATNSDHVYEYSGFPGSVRLASYFSGHAEGLAHLPTNGEWRLRVVVVTDETQSSSDEYVDLYLNGSLAHRWRNSPLDTWYTNDFLLVGNQFSYRFEFTSPFVNYYSHALVLAGSVWRERRVPRISAITLQSGFANLQLTNLGYGALQVIQRCNDLVSTGWSNAFQFVSWSASTNWSDPDITAPRCMFYRVQAEY